MVTTSEAIELITKKINDKAFIKMSITSPKKTNTTYTKITLENKSLEKFFIQISFYFENKVKHENCYNEMELFEQLENIFSIGFKQIDLVCESENIKVLINKKSECKIIVSRNNNKLTSSVSHNRTKNYILNEGEKIDWLIKLGIMTKDGVVIKSMYKKFRQINRYLEFISDISDSLPENSLIVDFGCGKSYLTFATYYFLNNIKNKNVTIVGLDLKEDVVNYCNKLAKEFSFDNLNFWHRDIKDYNDSRQIDMVITLHACDTATDYAIYNAIKWNSKIILSVPCCQHEINSQIKNELLSSMLSYGILKERFSSLLTDSLRADLLTLSNYKTQVLEFIDMEHTPKNIMIRAIKIPDKKQNEILYKNVENLLENFSIKPTLYELLKTDNII